MVGNVPKAGFSLFRFLYQNLYIIVFFIFLLITMIPTIKVAVQTNDYTYPFFVLGINTLNSDNQLNILINSAKDNFNSVLGLSSSFIFNGFSSYINYYWLLIIKFIFPVLKYICFIFFPFYVFNFVLTKVSAKYNQKSYFSKLFTTLILVGIFFLAINMFIAMHGLIKGNSLIDIPKDLDFYGEMKFLVIYVFPFKGMINFIIYTVSSIISLFS